MLKNPSNNQTLRTIMQERGLTRADVAAHTGRSVAAVAAWLRNPEKVGYRDMPSNALTLLQHELAKESK